SPEAGIDCTKDAKCRAIIWLGLHDLLLLCTSSGEGSARFGFVLRHRGNEALAEGAVEYNGITAKSIFAQRRQSVGSCGSVALGQRADEPAIRDILDRGGVFFPDGIDRLMQRPRVSL